MYVELLFVFVGSQKEEDAHKYRASAHQGSAAEQDHEYDEGFKPGVLHYDEAGFPECPPALKVLFLLVDLAALEPAHTACRHRGIVGRGA